MIDSAFEGTQAILLSLNKTSINNENTFSDSVLTSLSFYDLLSLVIQTLTRIAICKFATVKLCQDNSMSLESLLSDIESKELKIVGDETRITQIANNLISNAIKFTPCGGFVTVSISYLFSSFDETILSHVKSIFTGSYIQVAKRHQNNVYDANSSPTCWVVLVVEDTGCGVLEANFQTQLNSIERLPGVGESESELHADGLGLRIVKMHTEVIGGVLGIASSEGLKTLFLCVFPTKCGRDCEHQCIDLRSRDSTFVTTKVAKCSVLPKMMQYHLRLLRMS